MDLEQLRKSSINLEKEIMNNFAYVLRSRYLELYHNGIIDRTQYDAIRIKIKKCVQDCCVIFDADPDKEFMYGDTE